MNDINEQSLSLAELSNDMEMIFGVLSGDKIAFAKLLEVLASKSYTMCQKIPYLQLKRYIEGVSALENDLGVKISEKLFANPEKKNENALRVYMIVTTADTEKKIDYLVNATRALLLELIDIEGMFRIYSAIVDNLPEDLEYLSSLVEKTGPFTENFRIQSLARTGLMVSAGIDTKLYIESQKYYVSALGRIVDRFSLSMNDEEREKWYKENYPNP